MSKASTVWKRFARKALKILCEHDSELMHPLQESINLDEKNRSILLRLFAHECLKLDLKLPQLDVIDVLRSEFKSVQTKLKPLMGETNLNVKQFGLLYEALQEYKVEYQPSAKTLFSISKSDERRRKGSHYTPQYLTDQVVKRALEHLLNTKENMRSSDALLSLRICDPSVGAGSFLISCCEHLSVRLIKAWQSEELHQNLTKQTRLCLARRLIIERCLFACDIDKEAIYICRLALLSMAEGNLNTAEILEKRILVADPLIDEGLWSEQSLSQSNHGGKGFDLIVGNPPYISMYGRGSQAHFFSSSYLKHLSTEHSTIDDELVISGRVNLFLSFMVLATRFIDANHQDYPLVALVLPDTMITNEAYAPMRFGLSKGRRLLEVQKHNADLFEGANVGISVVFWGCKQIKDTHPQTVRLVEFSDDQKLFIETHTSIRSRQYCSWLPCSTTTLMAAIMDDASSVPLEQVAEVKDGFNTGSADRRQSLLVRTPNEFSIHMRLCLEGKWITPHKIRHRQLWIKTHDIPLKSRFDEAKIMYRQTAPYLIAAVDLEGLCYLNSAHAIIPFSNNKVVLYALCAYLNSDLFKARYQLISGEIRRTFPQVHVSTMKKVRVPVVLFDSSQTLTINLAHHAERFSISDDTLHLDQINQLVRELHENR
jgi:hypothetical protein